MKFQVIENLQRRQPDNDSGLVVRHAGAIGAPAFDAKRPRRGIALLEYRVHVGDQQDPALTGAGERSRRCCRRQTGKSGTISIAAPSFFSSSTAISADRVDAFHVAGAGIDIDQPLPQFDRAGLLGAPRYRVSACLASAAGAMPGVASSTDTAAASARPAAIIVRLQRARGTPLSNPRARL